MKLLIVIVNYRTAGLTVDCLRSLLPEVAAVAGGCRVVVTDNASGDDSADAIQKAVDVNGWGGWASVMPLEHNGGFAYGNNAAIGPALEKPDKPQYVYLLNPDTLALPGAVGELIKFLDEDEQVGIAGGRAENADGTVRRSAFRFHSVLGEVESVLRFGPASKLLDRHKVAPPTPDVPTAVDWVSGASMMVRREVFEQVGLLDERFFMYFEETDFCFRAEKAGWPCWYVPASRIIHLVGQSSGVTGAQRAKKRRPRYWFDSRKLYFRKNLGLGKAVLADLVWTAAQPTSRLLLAARRKPSDDPPKLWRDFVRYTFRRGDRGTGVPPAS